MISVFCADSPSRAGVAGDDRDIARGEGGQPVLLAQPLQARARDRRRIGDRAARRAARRRPAGARPRPASAADARREARAQPTGSCRASLTPIAHARPPPRSPARAARRSMQVREHRSLGGAGAGAGRARHTSRATIAGIVAVASPSSRRICALALLAVAHHAAHQPPRVVDRRRRGRDNRRGRRAACSLSRLAI